MISFFLFITANLTFAMNEDLGSRSLLLAQDITYESGYERHSNCRKGMVSAAKYSRLASVQFYKNHIADGKSHLLDAAFYLDLLTKKHCSTHHKILAYLHEARALITECDNGTEK